MSKFTPGPWYTRGLTTIAVLPKNDPDKPADKQPVIQLASTFGRGLDENAANARLIAAAPEMYELLKIWTEIGVQPTLNEARRKARELIAHIDDKEAANE